jgi:hypothetical protein
VAAPVQRESILMIHGTAQMNRVMRVALQKRKK